MWKALILTHSPILKIVSQKFKRIWKRWNCDAQDDVFSGNRILELCPESGFEVVVLDPPWESKSRGLAMGSGRANS